MAAETEILELEIHIDDVISNLKRLDREYQKSGKGALDFSSKVANRKKYKEAVVNLKQLEGQLQRTGKAAKQAGGLRGIGFFGQQVGFLVSDARYGLLGMSNNLSILVPQFLNLQKQAKEAGKSLGGEFVKALRGPTGILIAIQLLIVVLPEIIEWFKKWGDQSEETSKAVKELSKGSEELAKQIAEENELLKENSELIADRVSGMHRLVHNHGRLEKSQAKYLEDLGLITSAEEFLNLTRLEQLKILNKLSDETEVALVLAKQTAAEILQEETSDKVLSILGLSSPVEDLVNQADIKIKKLAARTGKSYADAETIFWNSPEGRIMSAKIIKARENAKLKEDKKAEVERKKRLKEMAEIRAKDFEKIMRESKEIQAMLVNAWTPDTLTAEKEWQKKARRILEIIKHSMNVEEAKIEVPSGEDVTDKLRQTLPGGYISIDEQNAQIDRSRNIAESKKQHIQTVLNESAAALKTAAQLEKENKDLARAGIIASAAAGSIGIWQSYHDISAVPKGVWATAAAVAAQAALAASTAVALKSLNSKSAPSAQQHPPNFNIIGATGNNQLLQAVQDQTATQGDQRVVLLESDLQMRERDNQVTQEQVSFG